jgi:hypothetical protein
MAINSKRIEISVKRSLEENNWIAGKGITLRSRQEIVRLNEYLQK